MDTFKAYFDSTLESVFYPDHGANTVYITDEATKEVPQAYARASHEYITDW